jgi:flagellar biosynthesis protein FlhB
VKIAKDLQQWFYLKLANENNLCNIFYICVCVFNISVVCLLIVAVVQCKVFMVLNRLKAEIVDLNPVHGVPST